jgi:membrane associated rhomboid family serine protease
LVINVAVFLVDAILSHGTRGAMLAPSNWGEFGVEKGLAGFQVWRLVTYQFVHAGFLHLLFNMIGLWIFGGMIERWWGSKRYLAFYLICGVGGALAFAASAAVPNLAMVTTQSTLVGASGCIMGCVAACMAQYGKQQIGLFLIPITFTIFTFGAIYIGLDILQLLAGGRGAGSAVAHLGGAGIGWLLVSRPSWLNWADRFSPEAIQEGYNRGRFERQQKKQAAHAAEVDRILDKVRDKGMQSLSNREKKTLSEETDRKRAG